ncbi:hypothetical protein I3843_03G229300 [Carya illinoinensis]|uniref:Histone acetyltransferase n=1 Tax=Carya illinoinensis TaxID=32201 RepID=A0A8T1R7L8_CARIL|nr:uncharacterized protein LOC122305154 [Carya illinoinensis]KAG6662494.1 hypothetical protein CIPAW_03G246700 [Carya illinoinensis]KAG7989252.1 hypothetical protein I3843_03G229300 [Carya illinoinensis]
MPRPGPRPYECVRRAWHSDRHQPMRGSIIQQIFRVVNESHSAATKKNKEWQEKLPIVVLKAEEIMYSKANSEAEYMNLETLWDRVNDAVNTIIRKDENTETGELLPPCIEAALNLGCIPVRASRSQRLSNPRSYLTPRAQEPASAPAIILDKTSCEQRPLSPFHSGNPLHLAKTTTRNPACLISESNSQINPNPNLTAPCNYPLSVENILAVPNPLIMERNTLLSLGTVYPLYYGTRYPNGGSQLGSQIPEKPHSKPIYIGKPILAATGESAERGVFQNPFSFKNTKNASNRLMQVNVLDTQEKPQERECDLSLRLGLVSESCTGIEKSSACEVEDVGSTCSQEGGKFSDLSPHTKKEFSFFPRRVACDPDDSTSRKWNTESEGQNMETTNRKRKAPSGYNDDG